MRRGLTLGFTGLFLTEEAMRKALGDTMPREWIEFVLSQSDRTRQEVVERVSKEMGKVISALDPVELLRRLFEGQTLEISAKIHFPTDPSRSAPPETGDASAASGEGGEPAAPTSPDSRGAERSGARISLRARDQDQRDRRDARDEARTDSE